IYCEWTNRCAGEAGLENSSAAWTRSWTTSEGDWRVVITSLEIKVELERIILSEIRRESAVLETIVEKPKSGSCHKLGSNLICKANSWSKIGLLRVAQPLSVFVRDRQLDTISLQQIRKTSGTARGKLDIWPHGNDKHGSTGRRSAGN